MDFAVWVKCKDGYDRLVRIDDVQAVEVPWESDVDRCNLLFECDDEEIWGYLSKDELWKIETYKAQVIEQSCGLRVAVADSRRNYRVGSFEIVAPYTLRICFGDGTEQLIDFQSVLAGELFGPLRDLNLFNQVSLDPEVHTLVWPNGADFDPATLHDWPEHVEALSKQARQWDSAAA